MKIKCKVCNDIIESTKENHFASCSCENIFIDGSYDLDGNKCLSRYGYKKEDLMEVINESI